MAKVGQGVQFPPPEPPEFRATPLPAPAFERFSAQSQELGGLAGGEKLLI
jgi:hypothetical protein